MSVKGIWTDEECEHDPRWTAVDAYALSHLHPPSRSNTAALTFAVENMHKNGMQNDATYPAYGKYLALQCQVGKVKHALEVGTLGAHTSIWIASQNPEIHITSLEINPKHAEVSRQNLQVAGLSDRVDIILGPALETMRKLQDVIGSGERPRFGFVFIDADKENNWAYFNLAANMTLPGGSIFVDNVVRKGNVIKEEMQSNNLVQGAMKVIEEVGKDQRVDAVVMQTVGEKNYDGFLMAVVK